MSIALSIYLQQYDLEWLSFFFSMIYFHFLIGIVFVILMNKENFEDTLTLMFGIFFLVFLQAFLKLLFHRGRPVFIDFNLNN